MRPVWSPRHRRFFDDCTGFPEIMLWLVTDTTFINGLPGFPPKQPRVEVGCCSHRVLARSNRNHHKGFVFSVLRGMRLGNDSTLTSVPTKPGRQAGPFQ